MADVTLVSLADYGALAQFLADFQDDGFDESIWSRRLTWWWDENPAIPQENEKGWVIRSDGEIVGFLGNVPTLLQVSREMTRVHSTTTWRVAPQHRNLSMKLFFKLMELSRDSLLFDTTPADNVVEILQALKFRQLPIASAHRRVIPLNSGNILRYKLGSGWHKNLAGKMVAPLWDIARFLHCRVRAELGHVRPVERADEQFDLFWEKTKDLFANTNVRTAEVLNWFCFGNENLPKGLWGYYANSELRGYMILRNFELKKPGQRLLTLECLDLWCDPDENEVVEALINAACEIARRGGHDLVMFPFLTERFDGHFARLKVPRVAATRRDFFKPSPKLVDNIREDNSYFVGAQGDYGL